MSVPCAILREALANRMLDPIDLDDELRAVADEVDDIAVERCLTAEVEALWSELAKRRPHLHLLLRQAFAEVSRPCNAHCPARAALSLRHNAAAE
jgi:hypothetical protein